MPEHTTLIRETDQMYAFVDKTVLENFFQKKNLLKEKEDPNNLKTGGTILIETPMHPPTNKNKRDSFTGTESIMHLSLSDEDETTEQDEIKTDNEDEENKDDDTNFEGFSPQGGFKIYEQETNDNENENQNN